MAFGPVEQEQFLSLLRSGTRPAHAAEECGVMFQTVRKYIQDEPTFQHEVETALTICNERVEQAVYEKATTGASLGAQRFWLESHDPETYAPRQRIEMSGKGGGPIQIAGLVAVGVAEAAAEVGTDVRTALLSIRDKALAEGDVIDGEVIEDDDSD